MPQVDLLKTIKASKKRVLVIDGDIVGYRAAAAAKREVVFGQPEDEDFLVMVQMSPHDATSKETEMMDNVLAAAGDGCELLFTFTGRRNWRTAVDPTYKSNRIGKEKPVGLAIVRKQLMDKYPFALVEGYEADDLMGLAITTFPKKAIAVTDDKDLKTVPGLHLHLTAPQAVSFIPERTADWNLMYQTLVGDTSDGYKGCPGVGEVAANRILGPSGARDLQSLWASVVDAYKAKKLTGEDALVQARLAYILRADKEDGGTFPQYVRHWNPPVTE